MRRRMITKRLLHVQLVLLAGFGTGFLLPHSNKTSPAGIAMTLPNVIGTWIGDDAEVTQKERDTLAKDTQFIRKIYTGPERDQIFVSIVLSGEAMTNSIHRPERCLPAQGWNVRSSSKRIIQILALTLKSPRVSAWVSSAAVGRRLHEDVDFQFGTRGGGGGVTPFPFSK